MGAIMKVMMIGHQQMMMRCQEEMMSQIMANLTMILMMSSFMVIMMVKIMAVQIGAIWCSYLLLDGFCVAPHCWDGRVIITTKKGSYSKVKWEKEDLVDEENENMIIAN